MLEAKKIRYRGNFILLIVFHLMLIAYPLVSKTVHVHHNENGHHLLSGQIAFNHPEDFCPIYNFEFYSFVSTPLIKAAVFWAGIPVCNSPAPHSRYARIINHFSLRAPPVA